MPSGQIRARAREEIQREVCRRLALGESLIAICGDEEMPGRSTVFDWLADDVEFRAAYSAARAIQAETMADQILEIANTPEIGIKRTIKADGSEEIVEGDMIEHRRLKIEARKWLASKLAPKKYGDASLIRIGEGESSSRELSREDIAVRLAAIVAQQQKDRG